MPSDSSKSAFKMASEDLQKYKKKYKKHEITGFFSDLLGLNYPSYQLFDATFQLGFERYRIFVPLSRVRIIIPCLNWKKILLPGQLPLSHE